MQTNNRVTVLQFCKQLATRKNLERVVTGVYLLSFILLYCPLVHAAAGGYDAETLYELQTGTGHYDPNAACGSGNGGSGGTNSQITIDKTDAQQVIQQAIGNNKNINAGYALYTANGVSQASYNATFENYGASITKSMLLVAYLDQVGTGALSTNAQSDLAAMIEQSDDAKSNDVYDLLNNPQSQIEAVAKQAGMTGFKYNDTGDSLYRLGQSQITADDFAKFFSKIDTMIPAIHKDDALQLLSNINPDAGILQANLPGTVYSKEGWKPEPGGGSDPPLSGSPNPFGSEGAPYIVNQAAQFAANGTNFGLAITVSGVANQDAGETLIKHIASALIAPGNGSTGNAGGCTCPGSGSGGGGTGTQPPKGGVWNSGLKPPYIVEQYAINVLEDLAKKENKPESDAVTAQHVLALVAWAQIEGGDINNTDLFNLYNTTEDDKDLQPTMQSTGSPAYKTFDDGVEATARTLASGHSGMVSALMDQSSTAKDFAHAESYSGTSTYPGTVEWAGAAFNDPAAYQYDTWYPILKNVEAAYSSDASFIIGTSKFELLDNMHDTSKLSDINKNGFGGDTGGGTTDDCGGSSTGKVSLSDGCTNDSDATTDQEMLAQEGLCLAWTTDHGNTPKPTYEAAMKKYNPGNYTCDASGYCVGNDCGVFTSTIVRASGYDKNYPPSGTGGQWSYVVSHPKLYSIKYNVTSMSDLQPGDILIIGGPGGAGGDAHTWMYVGKQKNGDYSVSASLGSRTGNQDTDQLSDPAASGEYMRVRIL